MNVRNEVQAVIFDEKDTGTLFLIVRKSDRRNRRSRWRLLKGGINFGEPKIDALKREIFEETGLKRIEVVAEIHGYEFVFGGTKHKVSSFAVRGDSGDNIKLQKSELAGCIWADKGRANELLYWRNEKDALEKAISRIGGSIGSKLGLTRPEVVSKK